MAADVCMINEKEESPEKSSKVNENSIIPNIRNGKRKETIVKPLTKSDFLSNFFNEIEKNKEAETSKIGEFQDSKISPLILPPGLDCNTLARLLIDVIGRKAIEVRHKEDRLCLLRACEILLSSGNTDEEEEETNMQHMKKFRKSNIDDICSSTESNCKQKALNQWECSPRDNWQIPYKNFSEDGNESFTKNLTSPSKGYSWHQPSIEKLFTTQIDPPQQINKTLLANSKLNTSADSLEFGSKINTDITETLSKPTFHGRTLLKGPGIAPRFIPLDRLPQASKPVDPRIILKDSLENQNIPENLVNIKKEVNQDNLEDKKSETPTKDEFSADKENNLANVNEKESISDSPTNKEFHKIPVINRARVSKKKVNVNDSSFHSTNNCAEVQSRIPILSSVNVTSLSQFNQDNHFLLPMDSASDDEDHGKDIQNDHPCWPSTNSVGELPLINSSISNENVKHPVSSKEEVEPPLPPEETCPDRFCPPLPPPEESIQLEDKQENVVCENYENYNFRSNNGWAQNIYWMPEVYNYNHMSHNYNWATQQHNFYNYANAQQQLQANLINYNSPYLENISNTSAWTNSLKTWLSYPPN